MLNILKSIVVTYVVSVFLISSVNASEPSFHGKIITDDNVTVAYSQQVYKLTYFGTPYDKSKITNLLKTINKDVPVNIKNALNRYFRDPSQKYKVVLYGLTKADVITIKNILATRSMSKGFSFVLSGERRFYPYGEFLTPVLGYNQKRINKENYTYLKGINGLEKEYAGQVALNIDFKMQQHLEKELYELKALYDAKEVISVIIDTDTFAVKAFASSNRYNPNNIKRGDIANLQIHAISYLFQLNQFGSIVEDLLYLNAKSPKYQIYADLELDRQSGIDLPYERVNNNKKVQGFKNYKVNFMQLVKSYIPFYSGGYIAEPKIAKGELPKKEKIISKKLAEKMKKEAEDFFTTMPGKKVTLEFKDYNLSAAVYMKDFSKDKHHYIQGYFTIYKKEIPYEIIVDSEQSPSNQYFECTIYSKNTHHKIATVIQPINKYQANKRNGTKAEIVGIYQARDKNYFIDTITTKGTKTATCNAFQTYNVETFKITDTGIVSMGLRVFNIENYAPYDGRTKSNLK